MTEPTGLENDFFGYGSEEELYEAVQSGEFNVNAAMTDGYRDATGESSYAPRPQDYQREGDYDAALAEWYASTPIEEVSRDADMMLWVVQAYNAGDMSAAEAQEAWDAAYESRYGDYDRDEDGNAVQNFTREDGSIRNTSTYGRITFGETDVSSYASYVSAVQQTNEQFTQGFGGGFRAMMQAVASNPAGALFLGVATGGITSALAGTLASTGLSVAASQALAHGLVNAALQGAINGEVDFTQALLAAAGGYLSAGGLEELQGMLSEGGELMQGFGDYLQQAQDFIDNGLDVMSGGQEWLADTIMYGGVDALEQLVTTGSISLEDALQAGLMQGAAPALAEWAYNQLDDYFKDYTETKWQIVDKDGNLVHEFSDYETASAWANSVGYDMQTGDPETGNMLVEVRNELPDWIEPIMEAGGDSAAALAEALTQMGVIEPPSVGVPEGSEGSWVYIGDGIFQNIGDPREQYRVGGALDGVVIGTEVSDDWLSSQTITENIFDENALPWEPVVDFDDIVDVPAVNPTNPTPPVVEPTPPVVEPTPPVAEPTPPAEPPFMLDSTDPSELADLRNELLDGMFDSDFDGSSSEGDTVKGNNPIGNNEDPTGEEEADAGEGGGEGGGEGDGQGPGIGGDLGSSFDPFETSETELYAYTPFRPAPVTAPNISYAQWLQIAQNRGMFS